MQTRLLDSRQEAPPDPSDCASRCAPRVQPVVKKGVNVVSMVASASEGLKVESVPSDHRTDERASRRADQNFAVVWIPTGRHLDGEKGSEMKRCTGDPPTAQDKSYVSHWPSISVAAPSRPAGPYRCGVTVPSEVQQFLERQLVADGHPPLSEAKTTALHNPERWMMIADEDAVVAVAVVATHRQNDGSVHWTFETAVERSMRFPAFEDRVLSEVLSLVPPGAQTSGWSRRPSLDASLERIGFSAVRSLSEVALVLPIESSPTATEQDFVVRSFNDDDVETLVSINAAAFGDHREAGSLDRGEVESLMKEPWFDRDGLLFHEVGGVVAGFCWTKVHDNGEGEIYRIGVDPQFHSLGIGRQIVLAGLEHLATKRACSTGFLWVDEANAPAMGLYHAIGFTTRSRNREFAPAFTASNSG